MAEELAHEGLAEAHDLAVALPLGVEIGAAFAGTDRQRGQGVLERLLERQELQHSEIHARVEAQAALVRTDGARELDSEASVDLDLAGVVDPRDPENDDSLRLHDAAQNLAAENGRVAIEDGQNRVDDLADGLVKLTLAGVSGDESIHELSGNVRHHRTPNGRCFSDLTYRPILAGFV